MLFGQCRIHCGIMCRRMLLSGGACDIPIDLDLDESQMTRGFGKGNDEESWTLIRQHVKAFKDTGKGLLLSEAMDACVTISPEVLTFSSSILLSSWRPLAWGKNNFNTPLTVTQKKALLELCG
jgi:O-glycosyl hydrolase